MLKSEIAGLNNIFNYNSQLIHADMINLRLVHSSAMPCKIIGDLSLIS